MIPHQRIGGVRVLHKPGTNTFPYWGHGIWKSWNVNTTWNDIWEVWWGSKKWRGCQCLWFGTSWPSISTKSRAKMRWRKWSQPFRCYSWLFTILIPLFRPLGSFVHRHARSDYMPNLVLCPLVNAITLTFFNYTTTHHDRKSRKGRFDTV